MVPFLVIMHIYRWQSELCLPKPVALTIGNFDGVHLGHQAIIARLLSVAEQRDLSAALMSFFPHPKTIIHHSSPNILTSLRDRAYWLNEYGLPYWILVAFTRSLMQMDAKAFVIDYLLGHLHLKYLLVGDDFRFGYQGKGDIDLLQRLSREYDFSVEKHHSVYHGQSEHRISSSLIRQALMEHNIALAESYLGHELTYIARVRHGEKRGRNMKIPTVNLHVPDLWCLPDGVYVVKVVILSSNTSIWGVANVGKTPTFAGKSRKIEAFLFDGYYDLYGQILRVEMKQFLRPMRLFADIQALQTQIQRDITHAREAIARLS